MPMGIRHTFGVVDRGHYMILSYDGVRRLNRKS